MKKVILILGLAKIPADITAISLAFLTSYLLRYHTSWNPGQIVNVEDYLTLPQYISKTYPLAIIAIVIFVLLGLYSFKQKTGLLKQIGKIVVSGAIWFMLVLTYYFLIRAFPFSRLVIIYQAVLLTIFTIFSRLILSAIKRSLLKKDIGRTRCLVIGNNESSKKVSDKLASDYKYKLLGYISTRPAKDSTAKWLGKIAELKKFVKKYKVDLIVQTDESEITSTSLIDFCRENHTEYHFLPAAFNSYEHKFEFDSIKGMPWLIWQKTPLEGWGRIVKRFFDLLISLPIFLICLPMFAIVTIAIKLNSPGTVFYKYLDNGKICYRIGQKGKPFYCYKFRTMLSNTHNQRYQELAKLNKRQGPIVKIENDPRITNVGKFLRRFDLDELPQIINVIKGNMSIVGPRPHLPEEVDKYDKHHKFVLAIKPGITGLAQVQGRSNLNFDDEVALDSYYIEHWSLWLDLKIIIKTIPAVLFKKAD